MATKCPRSGVIDSLPHTPVLLQLFARQRDQYNMFAIRMSRIACLVVILGCGKVSTILADAPDRHDASTAPCNLGAPFGAPVSVAGLDTGTAESVFVTADELIAIVTAPGSTGGLDLWTASRGSNTGPFGTLQHLAISTTANDYEGVLSPDGLTLYFNTDGGTVDILFSTRPALGAEFTTSQPVVVAATTANSERAQHHCRGVAGRTIRGRLPALLHADDRDDSAHPRSRKATGVGAQIRTPACTCSSPGCRTARGTSRWFGAPFRYAATCAASR